MRLRLTAIAVLTGLATVAGMTASAAPASASSPQLSNVVSQTPVAWTPNVSKYPSTYCSITYFGANNNGCQSEVYDTAQVNGDVVVVGAFNQECQPGPLSNGLCKSGSTPDSQIDIFAYKASTGVIDPYFKVTLNVGPAYSVIPGPNNTVYVGGQFTQVDGQTHKGLVQLQVTPGVASTDGAIVTGFKANVSDFVHSLALSPDGKALYVGGQFTSVNSTLGFTGLARLNATTGAVDTSFKYTLHQPISSTLPMKIEAMDLSGNGDLLAITYAAMQIQGPTNPAPVNDPRLAVISTGGTLGAPSALTDFSAPILSNNCSAEHDYDRAVSIAPDGSFLVIADTGYKNGNSTNTSIGSICDAVARFDLTGATTTTGTPVTVNPAWINYSGGDSFYSVTIAGSVVYTGGHNRWVNNFCGVDHACPQAQGVLVQNGLSAFDANTGMGLAWWHPMTLRGAGTMYMNTFAPNTYDGTSSGLVMGTDVNVIAGAYHSENAVFPTGPATTSAPAGPIPSGVFSEDGGPFVSNTIAPLCLEGQGTSATSGTVDLSTCVNDAAQYWSVPAPGHAGNIVVGGLCLDTSGGSVVLSQCNGSATQQWTQGPGNTVAQGSQCLTAPSATNPVAGAGLTVTACPSGTPPATQVFPLPVAPGSPTAAPTGPLFLEATQTNTQVACADDANNATPSTKVQAWTCRGDAAQNWAFQPIGTSGTFTIQLDSGYCLDSSGGNMVLDSCANPPSATQTWALGPNYTLVQGGSSGTLCLTAPNVSNGTQLTVTACPAAGTSPPMTQQWRHDGIGAPVLSSADTITVTNPGTQAWTVGTSVNLPITAKSSTNATLSFTIAAGNLPAGLSLSASTGVITGKPTTAQSGSATVTVTDTTGATASVTFPWSVSPAAVVGRIVGYHNMCVSDYNYLKAAGTKVVIDPCDNLLRERWTAGPNRSLMIQGMCLTDTHWGLWGTGITLEPCHGWTSQQWTHHPNGEYTVAPRGLCMTDPRWSTTSNTQIIVQSCRDWKNQRWSQV